MGFDQDKKLLLAALITGEFLLEARESQDLKNLLASDQDFTLQSAYDIVNATRGNQARLDYHHQDPSQPIWILRPNWNRERWYVKCYIDCHTDLVYFVSFHRSEERSQ